MKLDKEYYYNKYKGLIPKSIRELNCQYSNKDEYQDYYDAAEMGLLEAIEKFDPTREETTSYFFKSIKVAILSYFYYRTLNLRKINYLHLVSLDQNISESNNSIENIIKDETINLENNVLKDEVYGFLYKALDTLKPTYKDIICKYYGINSKRYTLQELADLYKVSRQAINVKRDNALKKLRIKIMKYGVDKNDLRLYD